MQTSYAQIHVSFAYAEMNRRDFPKGTKLEAIELAIRNAEFGVRTQRLHYSSEYNTVVKAEKRKSKFYEKSRVEQMKNSEIAICASFYY